METLQQLGIREAQTSGKKAYLATQQLTDALNAAKSPSNTNPIVTNNDVNSTSANLTPNSVVTTTTVTAGTGVITDSVTEKTANGGIKIASAVNYRNTLSALNSTGTISAAMLATGGITSTSAAGVTATLDTIANIGTQFGTPTAGMTIPFLVQNPGASTVTVAVSAGIVAAKQVSNGDTAVDVLLTVAASATVGSAKFELVFISATAAVLHRVF